FGFWGLLVLYDAHCHQDDWQEVLRLICGQLDEQFAGKIIAHLTEGVGRIDKDKLLPDLILAVWCLSEVKNLNQIEERIGSNLLKKVINIFLRERDWRKLPYKANQFFVDQISAAVKDIGLAWPGKSNVQFHGQHIQRNRLISYKFRWPHIVASLFQQRQWIEQLSQSREGGVRAGSLEALVIYWPDSTTRRMLIKHAVRDKDHICRCVALQLLSDNWPNNGTRKLLIQCAIQDKHELPHNTALEQLFKIYSNDDATRQLLNQLLLTEGVIASLYGREYSRFAESVFRKEPSSRGYYFDPRQPIPAKHIQKAAEKFGIPPDKIDETVRSLSEHMGWDITKGSGAG
ncbi:MAG: hypothetical protein D3910_21950, partial [Candidatus Electrothrix sp. ATG2]|nr:hypothetical protein [Candidatus Electrothrix sp. ATG2]